MLLQMKQTRITRTISTTDYKALLKISREIYFYSYGRPKCKNWIRQHRLWGAQGLGIMNENGKRFADMSSTNKLVIRGSIFLHKRIHKATWVSPDHVTDNQIDHFYISKTFRRSLQDVRVKRGADAASDHHLLMATLKLNRNGMESTIKRRSSTLNFWKTHRKKQGPNS